MGHKKQLKLLLRRSDAQGTAIANLIADVTKIRNGGNSLILRGEIMAVSDKLTELKNNLYSRWDTTQGTLTVAMAKITELEEEDTAWGNEMEKQLDSMTNGLDALDERLKRLDDHLRITNANHDDYRKYAGGQFLGISERIKGLSRILEDHADKLNNLFTQVDALSEYQPGDEVPYDEPQDKQQKLARENWTEEGPGDGHGWDGQPLPSEEEQDQIDNLTPEMVEDMLGLVSVSVPIDVIRCWPPHALAQSFQWAAQQHLIASDNEFEPDELIARPTYLAQYMRKG